MVLSILSLFEAEWVHCLMLQLWGKKSVVVILDHQPTETKLLHSLCPLSVGYSAGLSWMWRFLSLSSGCSDSTFYLTRPPAWNPGCLPYRAHFLLGALFPVETFSTFWCWKAEITVAVVNDLMSNKIRQVWNKLTAIVNFVLYSKQVLKCSFCFRKETRVARLLIHMKMKAHGSLFPQWKLIDFIKSLFPFSLSLLLANLKSFGKSSQEVLRTYFEVRQEF